MSMPIDDRDVEDSDDRLLIGEDIDAHHLDVIASIASVLPQESRATLEEDMARLDRIRREAAMRHGERLITEAKRRSEPR